MRAKVQQQILLLVRVTSRDAPLTGRLHAPSVSNARVLALGEDRREDSTPDDGVVQVFERRFAIFPSEAGTLTIPPLRFDAWRVAGGDPVPFNSKPLSVQVDPIPIAVDQASASQTASRGTSTEDRASNRRQLPARLLTLTEACPPAVRIAPGQALERMVTLRAEGIMAEDLPAIPLAIPFQLRIRDDAPRLWNERTPDGVIGYRGERILIGTAEAGTYRLPAATVDWWNTATESWHQAALPDWTLTVAPFASADRRAAAIWERPTAADGERPANVPTGRPAQTVEAGTAGPMTIAWLQARPWLTAVAVLSGLVVLSLLRRGRAQKRNERLAVDSGTEATHHHGVAADV